MKTLNHKAAANTKTYNKRELKNIAGPDNVLSLSKHFEERMEVIRFFAMASIVWGHCLFSIEKRVFNNLNDQIVQSVMLQFGRMGTIMFFIISGYFISGKINKFTITGYLRYRAFSLILPWFIFLVLLMAVQLVQMGFFNNISHQNISSTISICYQVMVGNIFHSAYWFVPVAIISALILIVFKKYSHKLWFGLLLAAITLFYSVNLHCGWISANHTKAVLGYTFFMWLGIQLKLHAQLVQQNFEKLSSVLLVIIVLVLFVASCTEGMHLSNIHSEDPYASVRISNSLLSIVLFTLFLKTNFLNSITNLKPQRYTFGVYLVHCIVILFATPFTRNYVDYTVGNVVYYVSIELAFFISVFTISYLLSFWCKHFRTFMKSGYSHASKTYYTAVTVNQQMVLSQYER